MLVRTLASLLAVLALGCRSSTPVDTPAESSTSTTSTTDATTSSSSGPSPTTTSATTGTESTGVAETTALASTEGSSDTSSVDESSSETTGAPSDYGPCERCDPAAPQLDGGNWCVCTPPCRTADDCPDPGTGATPACSSENDICVLLCETTAQCPEGALCPDPADLPEGAQGFCYFPEG